MRRGITLGIAAYTLWGVLPVYWKALDSVGAFEILAHRIVWSVVLLGGIVTLRHSWSRIRALRAASVGRLALAGAFLGVNWGTYIWAVNHEHMVDASLGYFINPLFSVALGVLILSERLNRTQWTAIAVAGAGVAYLTITSGTLPWVALVLAGSFGMYGLLKKQMIALGPFESLGIETAFLAIPALVLLVTLAAQHQGAFGTAGLRVTLLLIFAGAVTAAPLLLFGAAAAHVPLSTLGLLQYIAPSLQFLIGVFIYSEAVDRHRLTGFILVWLGLLIFTGNGLARRGRSPVQPAAA